MKKKVQTFSKDLKMPQLYRNDLEAIERVIKEELKPREYKLETKEYEYDSLELIPEDAEPVTDFRIQTSGPYISVELNRFSARVYAGNDDINTTGALTKILGILSKRERKVLFWSQKIAMLFAPILFAVSMPTLTTTNEITSVMHWIVAISVPLIAVFWWLVSVYSSMYKFSTITFISSKKSPGFIKRNRDQILVGLIVGIPVAIVGFILGLLFQGNL